MKRFATLILCLSVATCAYGAERKVINRGTVENDETGEGLFSAFGKINDNFQAIWGGTNGNGVGADTPFSANLRTNTTAKQYRDDLKIAGPIVVTQDPYNATGNGTTDDSLAIQTAINDAGEGSAVYLPKGTYRITSPIVLSNQIQTVYGDGARATYILFDPAQSGSAFQAKTPNTASKLFQIQIRGLGFQCVSNAIPKTAIELYDVSSSLVDDIEIYPWTGSTTNNVGIWWRGRDTTKFHRIVSSADIPLRISDCERDSRDIDQVHFQDMELIATKTTSACILIDAGVNLTEVSFDGYQTWSQGKHGLYWWDTNNVSASLGLHIRGMRREQCQDAAGYNICIIRGAGLRDAGAGNVLQNFTVRDTYLDTFQNGVYLRGVNGATFDHVWFSQSAYEQLNADDTCQAITLASCFSQQSGTAILTGLTNLVSYPTSLGGTPLPESGVWLRGTGGNQPLLLASTIVRGKFSVGTDGLSTDALMRIEQADDTTNEVKLLEFVRTETTTSTNPSRITIPFKQQLDGIDYHLGKISVQRPNSESTTASAMEFSVNPTSLFMDDDSQLQAMLRIDGPQRTVMVKLQDDSTNGLALYPLRVRRDSTNTTSTSRTVGLTFEESTSGVNAFLGSIAAIRENSEGNALASMAFGVSAQPSIFPTDPDDMLWLLHIDSVTQTVNLGLLDGVTKFATDGSQSKLDVDNYYMRIRTANTPASAAATGVPGEIRWDTNYVYVAVGTNEWKRAALSTWP